MPVDASPYRGQAPAPNLLQQIQELGGAAQALGQIEVGKGLQQAIRPDGTLDRNVLAQHLKGTVAGSMQATKALTDLEHQRTAGYGADSAGLETMSKQLGFMGSILGPLAERARAKGGLSHDEMKAGVGKFITNAKGFGFSNPVVEGMEVLNKTQGMTDKERGRFVQDMTTQVLDKQAAFEAHRPQVQGFDTGAQAGGVVAGTAANPNPAIVRKQNAPGSEYIQNDPNQPGYREKRVRGEEDAGPPIITQGGRTMAPAGAPGRAGGVVAPGAPAPAGRGGTAPASPVVAPAPSANNTTALSPEETGIRDASTANFAKAQQEAGSFAERINPLKSAEEILQKTPKGSTGPGTEGINKIKAAMQVWGIPIPGESTMNDYVKLHKYLEQNIAATAPAGTNVPGVMQSIASNPNTGQPTEALTDLVRTGIALTRMRQAAYLEFREQMERGAKRPGSNAPLRPGDFNDWMAAWSTRQDPRAYAADLVGKKGRDKFRKIDPETPEGQRFRESYNTAKNRGLF